MSDKIAIELTREEAEAVVTAANNWPQPARDKIRAALAEHGKQAKRELLRLPWNAAGDDEMPLVMWPCPEGGAEHTQVGTMAQARLMAAAPDLAEALEELLEWTPQDAHPESFVGKAQTLARAALAKAGW